MGNRQIFEKETDTLILSTDVPHSHHTAREMLSSGNPLRMTYNSAPLVLLEILLVYQIIVWLISHCKKEEEDDKQLEEGLADYFKALDENDGAVLIGSEKYYFEKYGIKTISDEKFVALEMLSAEEKIDEKTMQGVGTYRVLDNPLYMQIF